MSAKDALDKYFNRISREQSRTMKRSGRRNAKPEFEFKKIVTVWLESRGFMISSVEAKAAFSEKARSYRAGPTEAGFSDLVGVTPHLGVAAFIELKAPGRRGTLKSHQRDFLADRINKHAFACVTDSIEHLSKLYMTWVNLRSHRQEQEAIALLLADLPKVKSEPDFKID